MRCCAYHQNGGNLDNVCEGAISARSGKLQPVVPKKRNAKTLPQILQDKPGRATWDKIRKRLDMLSGPDLDSALEQVQATVKKWDPLISRPPLKSWAKRRNDPRLKVCRIVHETDTYNDYILAMASILTRDGLQAVHLERQFTGMVQSVDGKEMVLGAAGSADLKGGLILEWDYEEGVTTTTHRLGVRLEVEVKAETGEARAKQLKRQAAFMARGECYIIAHSIADAVQQVREWKERKEKALSR